MHTLKMYLEERGSLSIFDNLVPTFDRNEKKKIIKVHGKIFYLRLECHCHIATD